MNILKALEEYEFYSGNNKDVSSVSVTEVTGGEVLPAYLKRTKDAPKQDNNSQALLGNIFDVGMRELAKAGVLGDGVVSGERISMELPNGYTLTGEPDLIDTKQKIIYDVKLTKVYAWQKVLEEDTAHQYVKQLNYYRLMMEGEYGMELFMGLKDQSDAKPKDPKAIELVSVSNIADEKLISEAVKFSDVLDAMIKGEEPIPNRCTDIWGGNKCKFWCSQNIVCEFAKRNGYAPSLSKSWGIE